MPDSSYNIREDFFQKQHAEAMHALIWAFSVAQQQNISADDKTKIQRIAETHQKTLEKEAALQAAMEAVNNKISDKLSAEKLKEAAAALKKYEQSYLEDLERKATRHKLSLFFAFFMAVGCGTTLAGSNFLMGIQYNWITNVGFLSMLAIVSVPIIVVVSMANWWLGVRAVPDLENKNKDPYLLSEKWLSPLVGKYTWWNSPLYAMSIFFIEIYNALTYNFQQSKAEAKKEKENKRWYNSWPVRLFWYLTVFLGAAIYAFFAFAATYDLGMGFLELLRVYSVVGNGAGSFYTAAVTSSAVGVLMAVPTYITMKIIYFVSAKAWMTPGAGPLSIIEEIPGWNAPRFMGMNLKQMFIFFASLIVISVGFMTYAAVDPLAAWFTMAGMSSGQGILATVTIAIAFIGNIPFYVNSAAKSFKQLFDPREQLQANNSKWFPYIRFWNATLNALPAIVGVLAFLGLLGLSGPGALLIPIALNVLIGGAASFFANSNGTPTMYKFDAAKEVSKYQLSQLSRLENEQKIQAYDEMTPDAQLKMEYHGAEIYLREGDPQAPMPVLAMALHSMLDQTVMINTDESHALYQAFIPTFAQTAFLALARSFSAVAHGNVRYTKYLFPNDYLSRVEYYGSDVVKKRLYDAALMGGGEKTAKYRDLLDPNIDAPAEQNDISIYVSGAQATLFWKAYSVRTVDEQQRVMAKIPDSLKKEPEVQERLMRYSRPETRKEVVRIIENVPYLHHEGRGDVSRWKDAYSLFNRENYFETNALTGFWVKNLMFPLILLADGVASLGKKMMNSLGLGKVVANPLNLYDYLTEQADDDTRKIFLCDVLCGYMMNSSISQAQSDVAEKFRTIILGDDSVTLSTHEVAELKTGLVGCVFDVAISIPDVKASLASILDTTAQMATQKVESTTNHSNKTNSSSDKRHASTGNGVQYFYAASRQGNNTPAPTNEQWVASHHNDLMKKIRPGQD